MIANEQGLVPHGKRGTTVNNRFPVAALNKLPAVVGIRPVRGDAFPRGTLINLGNTKLITV